MTNISTVYIGRNTSLLEQRDATICVNLTCDNVDYMDITWEHCPNCRKKLRKTIRTQEPPYVKV